MKERGGEGCKTKLCAEMMQQQDLRREIAALKSLRPSKFDRIAEDTQMLSSDDCAIKQRLENIENESEREREREVGGGNESRTQR